MINREDPAKDVPEQISNLGYPGSDRSISYLMLLQVYSGLKSNRMPKTLTLIVRISKFRLVRSGIPVLHYTRTWTQRSQYKYN